MRDIGLLEDGTVGSIAERFIEWNNLHLGVQNNGRRALFLCLNFSLLHDIFAISFSPFDAQQPTYMPHAGRCVLIQARIGNHTTFAMQRYVNGGIVDVVHVQISAVLLAVEDDKTGFEKFV